MKVHTKIKTSNNNVRHGLRQKQNTIGIAAIPTGRVTRLLKRFWPWFPLLKCLQSRKNFRNWPRPRKRNENLGLRCSQHIVGFQASCLLSVRTAIGIGHVKLLPSQKLSSELRDRQENEVIFSRSNVETSRVALKPKPLWTTRNHCKATKPTRKSFWD